MTDSSPSAAPDTNAAQYPGIPRWVKASGIVVLVLILLVVGVMVVRGGQHGPGMHMPSGAPGAYTPSLVPGGQGA